MGSSNAVNEWLAIGDRAGMWSIRMTTHFKGIILGVVALFAISCGNDRPDELPLIAAARTGDLESVRKLIQSGADVDIRASNGGTPLFYAVGNRHIDVVNELLNRGAEINAVNQNGETPIYTADLSDREDLVAMTKFLVSRGASINHRDNYEGTPLFGAVDIYGSIGKARYLLEQGAGVNAAMEDGTTPLIRAASNHFASAVALLLEYGADPNIQDKKGQTALMVACKYNAAEVVTLLLKGGANTQLKNYEGLTALQQLPDGADEIRQALQNGSH